ncbi:MAG: hypothetical protein EP343_33090 [Deltaproteobacteria bacterium]|nr:MAG: hypothetical protein EP343_33090 [Deltaproteobacteria bacterium]
MSQASLIPPSPEQEDIYFSAADETLLLEGKLYRGPASWGAVICHPHPQHGGTMYNKVVDSAMRGVASLGGSVLRFNYRGVGHSEGSYGEGIGEVRDLKGAVQLMDDENLSLGGLLLVGFSFGTGVISRYLSEGEGSSDGTVLIAPPLQNFSLPTFPVQGQPWGLHMILGEHDQFCTPALMQDYAASFDVPQVRTQVVDGADHFFHGLLHEVVQFIQGVPVPKE